jgi:hypothetical protein
LPQAGKAHGNKYDKLGTIKKYYFIERKRCYAEQVVRKEIATERGSKSIEIMIIIIFVQQEEQQHHF